MDVATVTPVFFYKPQMRTRLALTWWHLVSRKAATINALKLVILCCLFYAKRNPNLQNEYRDGLKKI